MTDRSDLVAAIHNAKDGRSLSQAVAALDAHDQGLRAQAAAGRELDLGAETVASRLQPAAVHELHTAATDWLADFEVPDQDYRTAMVAEASVWYRGLDPAVREDGQELGAQARGRAATLASAYGQHRRQAEREFLQMVGYLHQGASGLPQIDQTIDPDNAPSPTPYPTEVFPTFGEEQDPFNGVETNNHDSGVNSNVAPMLQQLQQQQSGSGYGSGPERADQHDTSFDTTDSYAEIPLGAPGTLPTSPPMTDSAPSSHPNPVAGTDQVASGNPAQGPGEDKRQMLAAVQGYSYPDAFGYRWVTTAEVLHPFHERCASAHWPTEPCGGGQEHTASVAVGYQMDLHKAARLDAAERLGAGEGLRAYQASRTVADLVAAHNRFTSAWGNSDRTDEDSAVLHGFMAVVRPVMADLLHEARDFSEAERKADAKSGDALPDGKLPIESKSDLKNAERLKGKVKGDSKAEVDAYMRKKEQEFGGKAASRSRLDFREGAAGPRQGASSLTQVQQIVDPNNAPTPQDDDLPDGVAFPLNPDWQQQWEAGPDGASPKGATPKAEAAGMKMPEATARMFGHMDALEGRDPHHKDNYPFSARVHGAYLRGWNANHAVRAALNLQDPINREAYSGLTGRPDLHAHWRDVYDTARRYFSTNQGSHDDGAVRPGDGSEQIENMASRKTADAWSQPRQSTDDLRPPVSTPETNVPMVPPSGDYEAGAAAGKADRAAGERPAFADNSSMVSQYVKGYSEAYAGAQGPQDARDVPYSMGGDSGQAMNSQDAERAYRADPLSGVSAAFVPASLRGRPMFRKGYLFARKWKPGMRLVSAGSAEFEAGLYAGVTDRPEIQQQWLAAHTAQAGKHPDLAQRIKLHGSFTAKTAGRKGLRAQGIYLHKAGTTTDLITDGPGTSPDPMGATPLNGPGTPPPMGGLGEAALPGGAPPYQGAPPLPGGPVVPDDVMGKPQQAPQPSGPFTNTFSGDHPENATLAPVAPNSADEPGYSNQDAYRGDRGPDKVAALAAFRARVQAGLRRMGAPIHDEVEHHLRDGLAEFHSHKRAHPHMDLKEISTRIAGKAGPRELEQVLTDLVEQGRARTGPAYGEWEASG